MSMLSPLVGKRQYLVTYSQANLDLFPTRESFGEAVAEEFNCGSGVVKVDYWACCREPHANGGFHYHCSLKLTGSKKWVGVRNRLSLKYNIQVNFSDKHDFYLSSYRYVCKSDNDVFHSEGHPIDLLSASSPISKRGTQVSKENARKRRSESLGENFTIKKRPVRLTNLNVADLIKKEKVKNYTDLLAKAETRREAGEDDLANFVFSRSEKILNELVRKTWAMSSAKSIVEKSRLSRMDILRKYTEMPPCSYPCDGEWLVCAKEILVLNKIPISEFSKSLRLLLQEGRAKHRNLLLTGPRDCGKTFLLKPLQVIYEGAIFENPANDKFSWVGADKAHVIFLNDFRWSKEAIPWKDLLLLLEGEPVRLPAPKNIYAEDILINSDIPIFATSKRPITFRGSYGTFDETEDQMMEVRWKNYKFFHQFAEEEKKKLKSCAKCFCDLVFYM